MEMQNPRMVWVGGDFKNHVVPSVGRAMDILISSSPSKCRKILLMQENHPLKIPILEC